MSRHWLLLTILGFVVAGIVFLVLWWAYGRLMLTGSPKGQSLRRKLAARFDVVGGARGSSRSSSRGHAHAKKDSFELAEREGLLGFQAAEDESRGRGRGRGRGTGSGVAALV